jgi:hypothetical protein
MHPAYKAEYFVKQNWEDDWIKTAKDLVRTEWDENYKPKPKPVTPSSVGGTGRSTRSGAAVPSKVCQLHHRFSIPCSI